MGTEKAVRKRGTNGAGVWVNLEEDMNTFDHLPPEFRKVLRELPINVATFGAAEIINRWGVYGPDYTISILKSAAHASHVDIASAAWQWSNGPHPFVEDSRNKQHLTLKVWRA